MKTCSPYLSIAPCWQRKGRKRFCTILQRFVFITQPWFSLRFGNSNKLLNFSLLPIINGLLAEKRENSVLFKFKLPVTLHKSWGVKRRKFLWRDKQCKTCPEIWICPVSSPLLPREKKMQQRRNKCLPFWAQTWFSVPLGMSLPQILALIEF